MNIKLAAFSFVLSTLAFMQIAEAGSKVESNRDVGLGVIIGEPTGATGKFWLEPTRAIDVGIAVSFDSFTMVYGDYLFHFPGGFGSSSSFAQELTPYVGIGVEAFFANNGRHNDRYYSRVDSGTGFGARVPLGVEWMLPKAPLGIFAELVPGIGLAPSTFGFVQGGVGIRFYF